MDQPTNPTPSAAARREVLLDRIERIMELPLLVLGFAMVPALTALLLWDIGTASRIFSYSLVVTIWVVFAADLAVRLAISPKRLAYLRTHWLDVLAMLLPAARPLRIVWLIVFGSRAYRDVIRLARLDFIAVYAVGMVLVITTIVTSVERRHDSQIDSLGDALWWSVATVTTVGYGDVVPVTPVGRAFAYILMLGGIGLFGGLTANLASMLTRREDENFASLASLTEEVREMREELKLLRERDNEESAVPRGED